MVTRLCPSRLSSRMSHYKTLKAWQHAQRLAIEGVRTARTFPDYEQSGLADQFRRACYSVPLNIAEGNTRQGSREARRFFDTARGSLAEVETILEMARELGYITPADFGRLEALTNETGRTLFASEDQRCWQQATPPSLLTAPQRLGVSASPLGVSLDVSASGPVYFGLCRRTTMS